MIFSEPIVVSGCIMKIEYISHTVFLEEKTCFFKGKQVITGKNMDKFSYHIDESDIKKEKNKARDLRQSQWWKRCCSKGVCWYCNTAVLPGELTMDHIVPLSRGGKTTKGNVVPACKECNNKKKQLLPMEWEAYMKNTSQDNFER